MVSVARLLTSAINVAHKREPSKQVVLLTRLYHGVNWEMTNGYPR